MKIIDLTKLKTELNFEIDYFFCCASFEERCLSIIMNIESQKIKSAVLCYNEDQVDTFQGHEIKLKELLLNTNLTEIKLNSNNPLTTAIRLKEYIDKLQSFENKKFLIDITTFTHEALLILFRLLMSRGISKENIHYAYNNALAYSVNEIDLNTKWLSAGVKEIRSIVGFSGFLSPIKKNLLIVLVGFEPERTIKIIKDYQPDIVILGVGSNHCTDHSDSIDFNRTIHKKIQEEIQNCISFEFGVLDPFETTSALKKIVEQYSEMNIIIAPMNNKISTLGVAQLGLQFPNIQLCYVPARYYNSNGYSTPGKKCFLFKLD